jgi:hypothetical protein
MIRTVQLRSSVLTMLAVCVCAAQTVSLPQQSIIVTIAGSGANFDNGDGLMATDGAVSINGVAGVAVDAAGGIYLGGAGGVVRRIDGSGLIHVIAGSLTSGTGDGGDGGPATSALLGAVPSVAVDRSGNVYIADAGNGRVRVIYRAGNVVGLSTANPTAGFIYTLATHAQVGTPQALAFDAHGNLYIADSGANVVRVLYASGIVPGLSSPAAGGIYTVAGGGASTSDGVAATSAKLQSLWDMKPDAFGNIYISDPTDHRVRVVYAGGTVTFF